VMHIRVSGHPGGSVARLDVRIIDAPLAARSGPSPRAETTACRRDTALCEGEVQHCFEGTAEILL